MIQRVNRSATVIGVCGVLAGSAGAAAPPPKDDGAGQAILNAGFALGARVWSIRSQVGILPVVVIVPDDGVSYIEAVAHWTPRLRFPVLIDDGTARAGEDIARFVRGFAPTQVRRWAIDASFKPAAGEPPLLAPGIPEYHPKELAALVDRALARAWAFDKSASDQEAFVAHLKSLNLVPPGIVLCNAEDQAWTAGLALAAGHGQPIAWIKAPQAPGGTMSKDQAAALARAAEEAARATGLKWDGIGDEIESVSLCLNVPSKYPRGEGNKPNMTSTSDAVGRATAGAADNPARWAWSSVVFGTHARAAYSAMSALFLRPTRAWVFDGYPDEGSFKAFDGTAAGNILRDKDHAALEVVVDDAPRQGEAQWQERGGRAIDASLVMLNSRGNADFFDVNPGRLKPADIPVLAVPAAVYMVHSWSAADVSYRSTVAGRWFDHGVFAYFGSVEEPFLQAFVPTPVVAARLVSRFPWAAATRLENAPLWKLVCFGDPLWTLTPPGPRHEPSAEEKFPLEGSRDLREAQAEALKGGDFTQAIRLLALLGEDEKIARLVDAILKDKPAAASSDLCMAAASAVFRAGRSDLVVECFARIGDKPGADDALRDVLWMACRAELNGKPGPRVLDVLARNIRADSKERDQGEINVARARK